MSHSRLLRNSYETVHWKPIDKLNYRFPDPTDININMMPFVVEPTYSTIPEEYKGYIPMIDACVNSIYEHWGNSSPLIYYLTIQESFVEAGSTQRRPGLHTDAHASADWGGNCKKGDGYWHRWGAGEDGAPHVPRNGGIFIASTVPNSTAVWECGVKTPGLLGDCEELRDVIAPFGPIRLEANRLYWITDRTPHEALPMAESGYRQFFRLVTNKVDVWYEQHSTSNPFGVVPPDSCKIITENKFGVLLK